MNSSKFSHFIFFTVLFVFTSGLLFAQTTNFPFPQAKKYPYGNVFNGADNEKIKRQYNNWRSAWFRDQAAIDRDKLTGNSIPANTAYVMSPARDPYEAVSEGIAYGMLITVYMGTQTDFDKLWNYWKTFAVNAGQPSGMNWKIRNERGGIVEGSNSAADADIDAAVALVMASKQWGGTYLTEAQTLIRWIKQNLFNNYRLKPGNSWSEPFNPSYVSPAAFKLFGEVTNDAAWWNEAIANNNSKIKACQDARTGLIPDWCNAQNQPSLSGQVTTGNLGMNYDAARTPWRLAWGYYWYGDASSKEINDKIAAWLVPHTYGHASYIRSGYIYSSGNGYNDTELSGSVQSTFTGGVGLAMASATNPGNYMETVYETLINKVGRTSYNAAIGEEYFNATLNVLYLLMVSGNMPNLYNMTGYANLTPSTLKAPVAPGGIQLTDPNTDFNSFTNWGAFSDKFNTGTVMYPDSGTPPIYQDTDGSKSIKATLRIAAEPEWGSPEASRGEYPFAGIALSFDAAGNYYDLRDVQKIRVTLKTQGVIRIALNNRFSLRNDNEGGEPGYWFQPSEEFQTIDVDLSANPLNGYFATLQTPSWAIQYFGRDEVLDSVSGIKFEPKMAQGGYGSIEIKEMKFLNAAGELANIYREAGTSIPEKHSIFNSQLKISGSMLYYHGFKNPTLSIINLKGEHILTKPLSENSGSVSLKELNIPQGVAIIRISDNIHSAITTFLK
jgi:hypothetical protein